jgi:hypothetical protein
MDSYEHQKLVVMQLVGLIGSKLSIVFSNEYLLKIVQFLRAR